jgi:glutaredoxin
MAERVIMYFTDGCPACRHAKADLTEQGIEIEERLVNSKQEWLDEALEYAATVPIIIWPDNRVEVGWKGDMGCFII